MAKTVFVTGAGGFIGLNVAKEYAHAGWNVLALVHRNIPDELKTLENVKIIQGDVTDENFINGLNLDVDIVAHVAGLASDIGSYKNFEKINYEPIKYLSKIPKKKIIYVSSSDVYGIKDFDNATEDTPFCEYPKNPYPHYKIESEKWLNKNCSKYVIIRPAAVWGENDKTLESRVVDFLNTSSYIVHFGKWKGQCRWPLANVKNVAKTIVGVSEFDDYDNQAITIIDPKKTTIDEYYRDVARRYFPNKKFKSITFPMWFGKFLGFISTTLSNIMKTRQPLFDPTFYAVHHVSSNLDFSSDKMAEVINKYEMLHK